MAADIPDLSLVDNVIGRGDVVRLARELRATEDFLTQAALRQPGTALKLPQTGRLLDEIVQFNNLNLLQAADRQHLASFLETVSKQAPRVHLSFTLDPSPWFTQKLVAWLRHNIHPQLLIQIGLHPSIGAGCVLRTTNKYFDLSLRQQFSNQRALLIDSLRAQVPTDKVLETAQT